MNRYVDMYFRTKVIPKIKRKYPAANRKVKIVRVREFKIDIVDPAG